MLTFMVVYLIGFFVTREVIERKYFIFCRDHHVKPFESEKYGRKFYSTRLIASLLWPLHLFFVSVCDPIKRYRNKKIKQNCQTIKEDEQDTANFVYLEMFNFEAYYDLKEMSAIEIRRLIRDRNEREEREEFNKW